MVERGSVPGRWGMAVLVALGIWCGRAEGSTADGVLITNLAWATYKTTSGLLQNISYSATVNVFVATPVVMLKKTASATMQVSGGTVTFCISYSNSGGIATAFNLVITDAMPDNMRFVSGTGNYFNDTADGWSMTTPSWSTDGGTNWTSGSYPAMAQGTPLSLRWTVDIVPPKQTGFVCYTVSVL